MVGGWGWRGRCGPHPEVLSAHFPVQLAGGLFLHGHFAKFQGFSWIKADDERLPASDYFQKVLKKEARIC